AQRQTDIRVQTDLTTTVDFQIREATLELGEITVIAERPPVEPDKTTSKYIMSAEDLEAVPIVRDMGEFIELQAGVSIDADGNEIMIRGGDREDVAYIVDGVRISTTDSYGSRTGIGRSLNKSAVQELQVIT
ncbi:MAG: TonB-dependent receptor plug domain-containing protein, partial [Candidatus Latescibacteria bacterium]|nr:TonB-dependent receptor plug domain-containing protein [Candidatus Latescibacterota bacterium]